MLSFVRLCDVTPSVKNSRGLLQAPNRAKTYKAIKFLLKKYMKPNWLAVATDQETLGSENEKRIGQGLCTTKRESASMKLTFFQDITGCQWRIQTFATSANANVRFLIDKIYHAKFCETMRK